MIYDWTELGIRDHFIKDFSKFLPTPVGTRKSKWQSDVTEPVGASDYYEDVQIGANRDRWHGPIPSPHSSENQPEHKRKRNASFTYTQLHGQITLIRLRIEPWHNTQIAYF